MNTALSVPEPPFFTPSLRLLCVVSCFQLTSVLRSKSHLSQALKGNSTNLIVLSWQTLVTAEKPVENNTSG